MLMRFETCLSHAEQVAELACSKIKVRITEECLIDEESGAEIRTRTNTYDTIPRLVVQLLWQNCCPDKGMPFSALNRSASMQKENYF